MCGVRGEVSGLDVAGELMISIFPARPMTVAMGHQVFLNNHDWIYSADSLYSDCHVATKGQVPVVVSGKPKRSGAP